MAERGLHQVDRGATVEGVRGVRMAQPVRRYGAPIDQRSPGRAAQPVLLQHLRRALMPSKLMEENGGRIRPPRIRGGSDAAILTGQANAGCVRFHS